MLSGHPPTLTTIYHAGAVRDASGLNLRPGALAVRGGRILATGLSHNVRAAVDLTLDGIASGDGTGRPAVREIHLPDRLLLPALTNAHAHLILTPLDRRPYAGDFIAWVGMVMRDHPRDPMAVEAAIRLGVELSRDQGVGWLADVTTAHGARSRLNASRATGDGLPGVSFLEGFGVGLAADQGAADLTRAADACLADADDSPQVDVSLQPHAPYSAGMPVYEAACAWRERRQRATDRPVPLSTHLAETRDEVRFTAGADGPFADLLRRLGKWTDQIKPTGLHPIDWLAPRFSARSADATHAAGDWLLAHVNYAEDRHLALLADAAVTVAYCPIASEYFGHVDHRYREMIEAGVNVALGTDSILCQPADEPQPLSLLPPMRRLFLRDRVEPDLLLRMATGGSRLSICGQRPSLSPGARADLITVRFDPDDPADAFEQVLFNRYPVERVARQAT